MGKCLTSGPIGPDFSHELVIADGFRRRSNKADRWSWTGIGLESDRETSERLEQRRALRRLYLSCWFQIRFERLRSCRSGHWRWGWRRPRKWFVRHENTRALL